MDIIHGCSLPFPLLEMCLSGNQQDHLCRVSAAADQSSSVEIVLESIPMPSFVEGHNFSVPAAYFLQLALCKPALSCHCFEMQGPFSELARTHMLVA